MKYPVNFGDRPWRRWFAWYPVRLSGTDTKVWWEWIERSSEKVMGYRFYHYRLPDGFERMKER